MPFDLVVVNADLVSADGISRANVGVTGGIIQAVTPDSLTGREQIDATGKYLLPGLVDAHAHIPGLVLPTDLDDFDTATRAAAAGGVTTILLMPTDEPRTNSVEAFAAKAAAGVGRARVDYALQAMAAPGAESLAALADAGAVSFELFLAYGGMPDFIVGDDDYELARLLRLVRDVDGIAGITPHSPSLIIRLQDIHRHDRNPGVDSRAATRTVLSETLGLARALTAAAESGTCIHARALSARRSIDLVQRYGGLVQASSEVMCHHLLFTDSDARSMGSYGVITPPLRTGDDRTALREAVRSGAIDMVVSDHSPCPTAEKERGQTNIWQAPPGMTGLQTLCAAMLSLVDGGVLTLPDVVRLCCDAPSRAFRLHPRKGTLAIGADADMVIVDPNRPTTIRNDEQHSRARYTTMAGHTIKSSIERTILRGQTVFLAGTFPDRATGRLVRP